MYIALLNPQGNFDPLDSYWTTHPDFGGQLVYVKQLALAIGRAGHRVDILTRKILDPRWPEFAETFDYYPGEPRVRIVRLPAGPDRFLRKEDLWPHLARDWVPNILEFLRREGHLPDFFSAHYGDGGIAGVLLQEETSVPFTFTAHSLGAQKMDKLGAAPENLPLLQKQFHFAQRLLAERVSMNRSLVNIVSTRQERFEQYGHRAYRGAVEIGDDERFAVVPPGVNLEIFDRSAQHPSEDTVRWRIREAMKRDISPTRLGLPAIVASGRLDPKKNHLGLVEAFASHPELRRKANLVIITAEFDDPLGRERERALQNAVMAELLNVVRNHHLQGEISMFALRGQKELAAGYRYFASIHSVFALTSLYEPFGLAPLEAMAAGLPVVITQNGGPAESMRENGEEYGVLVDPSSPEDIALGLLSLLRDEEKWHKFSEAGYRRVLGKYTWGHTAKGYLDVFSKKGVRKSAHDLLPIPEYFRNPDPGNEPGVKILTEIYLGDGNTMLPSKGKDA